MTDPQWHGKRAHGNAGGGEGLWARHPRHAATHGAKDERAPRCTEIRAANAELRGNIEARLAAMPKGAVTSTSSVRLSTWLSPERGMI